MRWFKLEGHSKTLSLKERRALFSIVCQWSVLFFNVGVITLCSAHFNPKVELKAAPLNRIDLSVSYTSIQFGDWQQLTSNYLRSFKDSRYSVGLGGRLFRRELSASSPIDLNLSLPFVYRGEQWALEGQTEWSPSPIFLPEFALQLTPSVTLKRVPLHLTLTYRFAQYTAPHSQLLIPGVSYRGRLGSIGGYAYVIIPEFGPVLLTPQLRTALRISYFWRLVLWGHYGYETLNDRFVDPNRQAPQVSLFFQVRHLFNDWVGLNLGVSIVHFLPQNNSIAQERFNQDRLEFSAHTYWRF